MLEKMKAWLQTFPGWEDTLQIDYVEAAPGNCGLYPQGVRAWTFILRNVLDVVWEAYLKRSITKI